MKFKQEHSFEERKAESDRVRTKYPDRIPGKKNSPIKFYESPTSLSISLLCVVICEKLDKSKLEVRFLEPF
jgi:hypothetical protein